MGYLYGSVLFTVYCLCRCREGIMCSLCNVCAGAVCVFCGGILSALSMQVFECTVHAGVVCAASVSVPYEYAVIVNILSVQVLWVQCLCRCCGCRLCECPVLAGVVNRVTLSIRQNGQLPRAPIKWVSVPWASNFNNYSWISQEQMCRLSSLGHYKFQIITSDVFLVSLIKFHFILL